METNNSHQSDQENNKQLYSEHPCDGSFQDRVQPWLMACFGEEISKDIVERNHRFLEEAIELVQSTGCTRSEAYQLVDYVFDRPPGETHQEIGGVMVTLAALCLATDQDMHDNAEIELKRIWTKVEKIREKQANKPKHSPLPQKPNQSDLSIEQLAEETYTKHEILFEAKREAFIEGYKAALQNQSSQEYYNAKEVEEGLEMHVLCNEDDWSRNPQAEVKLFLETLKKVTLSLPVSSDRWISIKERLPETQEDVLLYMGKHGKATGPGSCYIGSLNADGKTYSIYMEGRLDKDAEDNADYWYVTHWRPLPELPTNLINQSKETKQ